VDKQLAGVIRLATISLSALTYMIILKRITVAQILVALGVIAVATIMGGVVIKTVLADATDSATTTAVAADTIVNATATTTTEVQSDQQTVAADPATTTDVTTDSATSTEQPVTDTATTNETGTAPESSIVGLVSVNLQCNGSYTSDLYDTPSGHLDAGYYPDSVPATTTGSVAHKIGTQSWTVCHDKRGNVHEFKLTDQEYADLAKPDATTPQKSIMESADQAALDSF